MQKRLENQVSINELRGKVKRQSIILEVSKSQTLFMGFTFLMDANTSKYFYNYFTGVKQALISH